MSIKYPYVPGCQEMKKPENAVSLYNHNFIKDYRMSVLTNWIIKKATQPKIPNSGSARMRPYDMELQERYPELDTNDGIYYLDNAFKKMNVDTGIKNIGTMQLGRLWAMYQGQPGKEFKTPEKIDREWNEWINEERYSPEADAKTQGQVTQKHRRTLQ